MLTDSAGVVRAADGATLAYRIVGDGPVAVTALHSLALDGSWFVPLARALGPEYRVILPDLRGHGGSQSGALPLQLSVMAEDVVSLWDQLGVGSSVVVGVSLGGMVAQALASLAPRRVRDLVLIATTRAFDAGAAAGVRARAAAVRSPGGLAAMADDLMARWFGTTDDDSPWVAKARGQLLAADLETHASVLEAMPAVGQFCLDDLDAPVLVLAGRSDQSTPLPVVQGLADAVPGAVLRLVEGGHLAPFTHPDDLAQIIREFLESQS